MWKRIHPGAWVGLVACLAFVAGVTWWVWSRPATPGPEKESTPEQITARAADAQKERGAIRCRLRPVSRWFHRSDAIEITLVNEGKAPLTFTHPGGGLKEYVTTKLIHAGGDTPSRQSSSMARATSPGRSASPSR